MAERTGFGFTRRRLLGTAAVGTVAALTGCQVDTSTGGATANKQAANKIKIPDYPGDLPTGDVTLRWVDSGDLKSVFEKAVLEAYSSKHPNIKTNYQGSGWDTVNQEIPLGVRNNSAPDIFAIPNNMPVATAINEGWVRPIEDIVPDFDNWKANFGDGAFVPGVHVFNNKTYTFPLSSNRRLSFMSIYDAKNMAAAGYDDPVSQIKTWDDLYTALKKVTKKGNVGMMAGGDGLGDVIAFLASTAGWRGIGGMDFRTGKYVYSAPEMMQAFEFIHKLATDKLIVPGYLTLLTADARAQMTSGKAGMIFTGPWDIPAWKQTAPDWKYIQGRAQAPDGGDYIVPFQNSGANSPWVYAKTKNAVPAGQILAYMGSTEGQKMQVILSEGNLVSPIAAANEAANKTNRLDDHAKTAAGLANQLLREAPMVQRRKPDSWMVDLERKPVDPAWDALMQGIFTGQLKNAKAQFAKYDAQNEKSLDDAIKAAAKKGCTVTRDDYVFGNWNPNQDYTTADYQALG